MLYFDVTVAPFYPISDAGLKIAAHFYNHNMSMQKGKLNAVMFGKILDENQRKALVWDVERGAPIKLSISRGSHAPALADGITIRLFTRKTNINQRHT